MGYLATPQRPHTQFSPRIQLAYTLRRETKQEREGRKAVRIGIVVSLDLGGHTCTEPIALQMSVACVGARRNFAIANCQMGSAGLGLYTVKNGFVYSVDADADAEFMYSADSV